MSYRRAESYPTLPHLSQPSMGNCIPPAQVHPPVSCPTYLIVPWSTLPHPGGFSMVELGSCRPSDVRLCGCWAGFEASPLWVPCRMRLASLLWGSPCWLWAGFIGLRSVTLPLCRHARCGIRYVGVGLISSSWGPRCQCWAMPCFPRPWGRSGHGEDVGSPIRQVIHELVDDLAARRTHQQATLCLDRASWDH